MTGLSEEARSHTRQMSEWDSLQDDGGLWGCENTLYQEVARLREALARTEDELGSFYRFGECSL